MAILLLSLLTTTWGATRSLDTQTTAGWTVKAEPWGKNSLRVRARLNGAIDLDRPGALLPPSSDNKGAPRRLPSQSEVHVGADTITNGNLVATLGADGLFTFTRHSDGAVVLNETARTILAPTAARAGATAAGAAAVYAVELATPSAQCCKGGEPCALDVSNWDTRDGAAVALSNFHATKEMNQRWTLSGGQLVVALDDKCLTSASSDAVSNIVVKHCQDAGDESQQWAYNASAGTAGSGATRTALAQGAKCLGATGALKCGGAISLLPCVAGDPRQTWTVTEVAPGPGPAPPPRPPPLTAVVSFASGSADQIFGFGEHQAGKLNMKGTKFDMEQCLEYGHSHGGEVCLPWIMRVDPAAPGSVVGLLWNMPNYGGVDFGALNGAQIEWRAIEATQVDYFVTVADAAVEKGTEGNDVLHNYVDAVGHAPMLPAHAVGYWHSRNRYASQAELLAAAEGFHNRSIPVSIIVIDYNHWARMGDWTFDPKFWPDVPKMMEQLKGWGMEVMVSAWPFSATDSTSIGVINASGFAMTTQNTSTPVWWDDNNCGDVGGEAKCFLYDATQIRAREYVWSRLAAGYFKYGIKIFWLDASEPEISTKDAQAAADFYNSSIGTGGETGMMFPYYHTQMIHDGLVSEGETEIVQLTRSAWAGMQRFGAALWSGDTHSSFSSLKVSIQAGLNTQMSGIAWWTTDIGGYAGGNPTDATFRELIVRWFQFGLTCPLFRQHGARATEPWGYGPVALAAIEKAMALRTSLTPYILNAMKRVSMTGLPINRPLWMDFADDPNVWAVDDVYMFGPSLLVAPVTDMGARNRTLYLPKLSSGETWIHHFTNKSYGGGGVNVTVDAPLDEFPLFARSSALPLL